MKTLYADTRARLAAGGIENPALEARILLKETLGVADADFITLPELDLMPEVEDKLAALIARRLGGEPLSRILGLREFYGLLFRVTPAVLDPRPDTEIIIERARSLFPNDPPRRILDLGTGSGALLVTLLHLFPGATGTGVDLSPDALAVAGENALLNDVADRAVFVHGAWFDPVKIESYDLIVSNPPYIPSEDIPNLESGVRNHDPILALDGGKDGLDAYKKIILGLDPFFSRHSFALFEVGVAQASDVARLAENAGFTVKGIYPDLAGIARVVEIASGEK